MNERADILMVTDDERLERQVSRGLTETGLANRNARHLDEAIAALSEGLPRLVLLDQRFAKGEAAAACTKLREAAGDLPMGMLVLVESADDLELAGLLAAGADDVVSRKVRPVGFAARVDSMLRRVDAARTLRRKVHDSELLIEVTSRLVSTEDIHEVLYDVSALLARELEVNRASVVLVRPEHDFGLVVASSDDPALRSLAIDLRQYPEIAAAIDDERPLVISDVASSALLREVLPHVSGAGVASLALFPIVRRGEADGVLFLRFSESRRELGEREVVFCQTVANATAIALRNAEIIQNLRAKTAEVQKVQAAARSQLATLKRYESFFLGAVDGMVVLSAAGRMLFVNPEAASLLGLDANEARGQAFIDLLAAKERERFLSLVEDFSRGRPRRGVDFRLDGEQRILSISAGSLFGEQSMVLLTMRDVTEERTMAHLLVEAHERLLHSEKKAAMIELAGAAAHELNQPLTSVMTTMALLRKMAGDEHGRERVLNRVEGEVERMAEIIRRLSQLTDYTTKAYVGESRIVDLEKAGAKTDE